MSSAWIFNSLRRSSSFTLSMAASGARLHGSDGAANVDVVRTLLIFSNTGAHFRVQKLAAVLGSLADQIALPQCASSTSFVPDFEE